MMTCCRYSELKSSVYNQTGEGFFDQLKAYNHMTAHLKKVYLAKSVVDSRNPNYLRRKQRCRSVCRDKSLEKNVSSDVIDRLAYDSENHPIDILRMGCNFNYHCNKCNRTTRRSPYCDSWYTDCQRSQMPCSTRQPDHDRSRSISRSRICCSGPTFHSAGPEKCVKKNWKGPRVDTSDGEIEISIVPHENEAHSSNRSSPRSEKSRYNDDATCSNYASSFESSSETSRQGSPVVRDSKSSRSPASSSRSPREPQKTINSPRNISDELKYSKFLFDITQEIVHNGFYTDKELEKVFQKHLKRNSSLLDKNKMLYEIYQLKLSLNIIDGENEEEEEGIEDFIRSRKFTSTFPVKPPTPPKVLDENKLLDKLRNQDDLRETYSRSPHNGRNAVVLVDANPEIVVTERDILTTLMETDLNPQQVHDIYKQLQNKSKDLYMKEDKSSSPMTHLKLMSRGVQSRFTPCGALGRDPDMDNEIICPREHCRTLPYHRESFENLSINSKLSEVKKNSSSKASLKIKLMEESSMFEKPEDRSSMISQNSSVKRTLNSESFTKIPSSGRSSKSSENSDKRDRGRSSQMKYLKSSEDRSKSSFEGKISSDRIIEMKYNKSSKISVSGGSDRSKFSSGERFSSNRIIELSHERSQKNSGIDGSDFSKSISGGRISSDRMIVSNHSQKNFENSESDRSKFSSGERISSDRIIDMNHERNQKNSRSGESVQSKTSSIGKIPSNRTIDMSDDVSRTFIIEEKNQSKSNSMGRSDLSDEITEINDGRSSKKSEISTKYSSIELSSANSSRIDRKDSSKRESLENIVTGNSEDHSRSPSEPERLQSIQEVSVETETQMPTGNSNYSTDDEIEEEEFYEQDDSEPENNEDSGSEEESEEISSAESINENLSIASHNSSSKKTDSNF